MSRHCSSLRRKMSGTALGLGVFMFGMTACGGIGDTAAPTATSPTGMNSGLASQVIGTDFSIGRNRFSFTLNDGSKPVAAAQLAVYFFSLRGFNALPAGHGAAHFIPLGTGSPAGSPSTHGVYVIYTNFDRAGKWGAEIDLTRNGKRRTVQTIFNVAKRSITPASGIPAPRSKNPTLTQETAGRLDSARAPDDMHKVSIADAIARHRPVVVLFASAAYCGIFQCGLEIAVVKQLEKRYRDTVDFVHVDVFQNARPPRLSTTAKEWHIPSQPWVFVINRRGLIAAKFEGLTAESEIGAAIVSASH